jgi:hypothetical protein
VPALLRLPPTLREQVLARQHSRLAGGDGLAAANVARARARDALATGAP